MAELSDILNTVGTFIQQSKAEASVVQENAKKAEAATLEIQKLMQQSAVDQALVTSVAKTAELKTQGQVLKISNAAAGDSDSIADRITSLMTKVYTSQEEVSKNLKEVRRQRETTPLTPVDWVVAQITLPFAEDKLKGAVDETKTYLGQVQDLNTTLQPSYKTVKEVEESVTAETVAASARISATLAQVASQRAAIESLKHNGDAVVAANNATKEQLAMQFNAKSAQNAEAQLQLSRQHLQLSIKNAREVSEDRTLNRELRAEDKQIDAAYLEKVNLAREAKGLGALTGTEARTAVKLGRSGASKEIAELYARGDNIKATGKAVIGYDPADSITQLSSGYSNLPPSKKAIVDLLQEAQNELTQSKEGRSIDPKDTVARNAFLNNEVKRRIAEDYAVIRPNSGNPIDPGDIAGYLQSPGIKELPIVTKWLGPVAASGKSLADHNRTIKLGVKAVADGVITSAEFQDLAVINRKAFLMNRETKDFAAFGISLPNDSAKGGKNTGLNFNVRVDDVGVVDIADPVVLGRVLSRQLAWRKNLHRKAAITPFVATGEDYAPFSRP